MNVVDSSAWLEYFTGGPRADFFAQAIEDGSHLLVPAIALYEVFKKVLSEKGEGEALKAVAQMKTGQVVEMTENIALGAAKISLEHKMPLADSVMLATAKLYNAKLWTQDEHFKNIEGVIYKKK